MKPFALEPMRRYFDSGMTRDRRFRQEQLDRLHRAVIQREQDIAAALYSDLKKSPEEAWATETGLLIQEIQYARRRLPRWMAPRRVPTNLLNLPSRSRIYPEPKGVVLIIGTWNFPLQLLLIPLVGAMAAGNCVVLKPSEHAPATAKLVEELLASVFPPEYIRVVQGVGAEVVPALLEQFRFDHIFYTGSTVVGRAIYQQAARDLIPVTLELGGKDPCIVERDADLRMAARRIAVAKFSNAGQMCVSPDYLLVHRDVKEDLVRQLADCIRRFYGPDPSADYNYGRIINQAQFDRLAGYLSQGKILLGGQSDREARYIAPTLMEGLSEDSDLLHQEIFGPILPVFTFGDLQEALDRIRRLPPPLSCYLFTRDRRVEQQWIRSLSFGNGCINNAAWQFTNPHLPFGGIGASGMGAYHGKYSFEVFTHFKALMKTPGWFDPALKYPPYQGRLRLFRRIIR
ncbi:MAG TPA: aldehyde dehydrogenase [Chitinophagaceae bacterium]|nr:aldehyde dehydrogenase [Chitinophagaceae bacterium]